MNDPLKIEYDEPDFKPNQGQVTPLEQIEGVIPRVTATPTWIPRMFKDNFAISLIAGNYKLHVYDPVANVWKSTALT